MPVTDPGFQGATASKPKKGAVPASFQTNWASRAAALTAAGYHPQHIKAVQQYDALQVAQGKKAMTTTQAYAAAYALASGKQLFQPKPAGGIGGFVSGLTGDVEKMITGLPKLPATLFHAGANAAVLLPHTITDVALGRGTQTGILTGTNTGAKGITDAWDRAVETALGGKHNPLSQEYAKQVKNVEAAQKSIDKTWRQGDKAKAVGQGLLQPGIVGTIPGAYVTGTALTDPSQLAQHPGFAAADILPFASKAAEGLAAGQLGTDVGEAAVKAAEPGSVLEAAAQGNVPKALFRSALGKSAEPLIVGGRVLSPITRAGEAALESGEVTALPRTSQIVGAIAESHGWDAAMRNDVYRRIDVARRYLVKAATDVGKKYLDVFGKDPATQDAVAAVLEARAPLSSLSDEMRPLVQSYLQIDDHAIESGVATGDLRAVPFEGEYHVYNADHIVVRYYDKMQAALIKLETVGADLPQQFRDDFVQGRIPREQAQGLEPRVTKALNDARAATHTFDQTFRSRPSRVWAPLLFDQNSAEMRALWEQQYRNGDLTQEAYQSYVDQLGRGVVPDAELHTWNTEMARTAKYWYQDYKGGARPRYVPNANEDQIKAMLNPNPIPDRVVTPGMYKAHNIATYRPGVANLAAQLTWRDMQVVMRDTSQQLVNHWGDMFGYSPARARAFETARLGTPKVGAFSSIEAKVESALRKNWVNWNDEVGLRLGANNKFLRPEDTLMPRAVADALTARLKQFRDPSSIGIALNAPTRVFRFAVTTSPRHIVHVTTAGMVYALGEQGLEPFTRLADAVHFMRTGEFESMPELGAGVQMATGALTTDSIREMYNGQVQTELLKAHMENTPVVGAAVGKVSRVFESVHNLEQFVAGMWKSASFLVERDKLVAQGVNVEDATLAAITEANRIHMDTDTMTPLERTTMRTVFPFYAFSRQILRYVFRYPGDHPFATSMIARVADIELQDRKSGLPDIFSTFITLPTALRGMGPQVDIKTFNPFRSLGEGRDPWTLAGVLSALNPAFRTPLEYLGINTLTGNVNQYLGQHVDPRTGSLMSNPAQGAWESVLQNYVPQTRIPQISMLLGTSTYLNQLQTSDPAAYRHALTSILGIPFMPFDAQANKKLITTSNNYMKQAQLQVSAAIKGGDYSALDSYRYVPRGGSIYTPAQLQSLVSKGIVK